MISVHENITIYVHLLCTLVPFEQQSFFFFFSHHDNGLRKLISDNCFRLQYYIRKKRKALSSTYFTIKLVNLIKTYIIIQHLIFNWILFINNHFFLKKII
jgi:hypothetical protein